MPLPGTSATVPATAWTARPSLLGLDRLRRGRGGGDRQAGRSSGRRRGSIWGRTQFREQVRIPITDADWVTLHSDISHNIKSLICGTHVQRLNVNVQYHRISILPSLIPVEEGDDASCGGSPCAVRC